MKRRTSVLIGIVVAVLCLPIGFAIAQATIAEPELPPVAESHEDPDPSTDAVQEMQALQKAHDEENQAAEKQAAAAMREEILSRMSPEDRAAAEAAPPQEPVPPGTKSYVPPSIPPEAVSKCENELAKTPGLELCELIVLHAQGKIRSGAFSADQQSAALQEVK